MQIKLLIPLNETTRRRKLQIKYNKKHNIIPQTIIKPVREKMVEIKDVKHVPKGDIPNMIIELETDMSKAANDLDFETAIALRDKIKHLKKKIEKNN